MSSISSSISKLFGSKKILVIIVIFILAIGIFLYSRSKNFKIDGLSQGFHSSSAPNISSTPASYNEPPQPIVQQEPAQKGGYTTQEVANPADLLPQDSNSQWSTLNPSMSNNNVIVPDLLQAGYHIGLDTIGQTLRNANLQLRSDPIIPKQDVGPWNQSTIEPDLARVPLELGYGCR